MIRDKITILPGDDPNKKRLGFKIYEIPWDWPGDKEEYIKKVLSPEEYDNRLTEKQKQFKTSQQDI